MGKVRFTDGQKKAIELKDRNLLVSAAAGSGKTAVLVERIIRRVLDKNKPVDIDRMLIMTFTNAAAAQMKEKIIEAIDERKRLDPFDSNLRKQSALVHNAMITTVHGFCLSVLKNHFNEASLSPDFKTADEGEAKLLRKDSLSEILEEAYEQGDETFLKMTESIAPGKTDMAIEEILDRLYDFSMSHPDYEAWLDKCAETYKSFGDCDDIESLDIVKEYLRGLVDEAAELKKGIERLRDFCLETEGLSQYVAAIDSDMSQVDRLTNAGSLTAFMEELRNVEFIRLGRGGKNQDKASEKEKNYLKTRRDQYKNRINKLKEKYACFDTEKERTKIVRLIPVIEALVDLTGKYIERYSKKKREANIIDYADMEHLAIRVLYENPDTVGAQYRELYEEIYVDEYQDTNLVQEYLLKALSRGDNLFMVGDVKQSIYAFRLARPDIFTEKYNRYSKDDSKEQRIDLSENFRSRRDIIDTVNELFFTVMNKNSAGLEYNEDAKLRYGACYYDSVEKSPEKYGISNVTELLIADRGEGETDLKELEAGLIADRIKELMDGFCVFDKDRGIYRPVRYGDIVILLRSARGWDDIFKKVLEEAGIPAHISGTTGYFEAYEVALLLDYLRVIDNPRQDIPLAAVMKGPFGRMDDEELAVIRAQSEEGCLYDALLAAGMKENSGAGIFLGELDRYRKMAGYMPVYDILKEIIDGEYGAYVLSMDNGKARFSNLEMLLKKADDYGKTSYKGLFQFIRYIDLLNKYEVDYGEANNLDENDDVVRIMTIHKSKGLEFPVCFVSGMAKTYNYSDQRSIAVFDAELGIGTYFVDAKKRTRASTIIREALIQKSIRELRAEEMRVLYVAMTRAREKLILTASVKDIEKEELKFRCNTSDSFLDLLFYADQTSGLLTVKKRIVSSGEMVRERVRGELLKNEAYLCLKEIAEGMADHITGASGEDLEFINGIREKLDFRYEPKNDFDTYVKVSVTELKKMKQEEALIRENGSPEETIEMFPQKDEQSPPIPRFVSDQPVSSGTEHGTAVHRIFELWDFKTRDRNELIGFIDDAVSKGRIEKRLADSVKVSEIEEFVNSPLALRMSEAGRKGALFRERPFVIELDGKIIQGIIDAYFIEDGKIVVVDYKTDRVNGPEELIKRYELQLDLYARALSILLGQNVGEKIIYSTYLKESISCR
ncbi:MAG: helicase-exonuclease AddAB subunit AddA [Lachnospiraceae bacterium]|nr:helicase-exonuclease AddAB subunit AddA [Lachnospiraceae bacterium]